MLTSFKIKLSYHLLKHEANSYVLSTMKIISYHGNAETKDCVCFLHHTLQDHLNTGYTYKQFKKSVPVFLSSPTYLHHFFRMVRSLAIGHTAVDVRHVTSLQAM
jgi:hypothetical protein